MVIMIFNSNDPGRHVHGPLLLPCLMTSSIWALGCYSGSFYPHFLYFLMTAFCIGTFAEFVPHRWFGLWHILIAMKPRVQLLGCSELHNACAIQCTNKMIFLRPQMTWETDTWKGLYLAECPLTWMCFLWRPDSYFEGWWSVRKSGHHPTRLSHIYFCCCLVHFTLVWFVFCS